MPEAEASLVTLERTDFEFLMDWAESYLRGYGTLEECEQLTRIAHQTGSAWASRLQHSLDKYRRALSSFEQERLAREAEDA